MLCINPFPMLRPVSKEEALKLLDYYGKIDPKISASVGIVSMPETVIDTIMEKPE